MRYVANIVIAAMTHAIQLDSTAATLKPGMSLAMASTAAKAPRPARMATARSRPDSAAWPGGGLSNRSFACRMSSSHASSVFWAGSRLPLEVPFQFRRVGLKASQSPHHVPRRRRRVSAEALFEYCVLEPAAKRSLLFSTQLADRSL